MKNKYNAKPTTVDGIRFHSKREAAYYSELRLRERAGEIDGLVLQPSFKCEVNGKHVCRYVADFRYIDKHGNEHFEDVKGAETPVFKIKKKLVEACFPGIEIEIVK